MAFLTWRKLAGLAVLLAGLAAFSPVFAQTGGITGKCVDEQGNPLVDHWILLERQGIKGKYEVKTNKKGEFIYIGLPIGDYRVTLQGPKPGRQNIFFINTRITIGDPTEVNFDMAKERAFQQDEQKKVLAANPELARQKQQEEQEQKTFTTMKQMFDQGDLLYKEKRYAEAAAMFEQAIAVTKEKDKNLPILLARAADSYQHARNREKAIEFYKKAIEANPNEADYHNNLGSVYADMGKTAEAGAEFQKAAELNPARAATYYFNYGVVMYNTGKMDESAEAFTKTTQIDPHQANAYFWLGQALMGKATMTPDGKVVPVPGTAEAYKKYLELDPNGPNAPIAQSMLATIEGSIETRFQKKKK
jgi:Flp pilus assembly protein TadD